MYDLSGLQHMVCFNDLLLLLLGVVVFALNLEKIKNNSNKKQCEKKVKTYFFVSAIAIIWAIVSGGTIIYHIYNPEIHCYEGVYLRESPANEARMSFFSWRYVFDDGTEPNEDFYLDSFSKKKIFAKDFEEGKKYRIYYEEKDDIIVKVEEID